ncbi:MAG: DUF3107 family protein [Actinobacteria bacterium]|nr:DUF3107 family protein [Actinomycetota bacterium]
MAGKTRNASPHEIIVPADKIGFVEVGESASRRVGFGAA